MIYKPAQIIISSLISLLLASIISIIGINFYKQYIILAEKQYQNYQALQIIENQLNLMHASQPCETQVKQNSIIFNISCSQNNITVETFLTKQTVELNH